MADYITVDSVRFAILDRSAADNVLDNGLSFGDDEIKAAMGSTQKAYDALPPLVHHIRNPERIPDNDYMTDGVLYHLYMAYWARAERNRVSYSAGNMVADPEASRLEYIKTILPQLRESFRSGAKTHKITINLDLAYGTLG